MSLKQELRVFEAGAKRDPAWRLIYIVKKESTCVYVEYHFKYDLHAVCQTFACQEERIQVSVYDSLSFRYHIWCFLIGYYCCGFYMC